MPNLKLSNIVVSKYQGKIGVLLANLFVITCFEEKYKLACKNIVLVLPEKQFVEKKSCDKN